MEITVDVINQVLFLGLKITVVIMPIVILLDRSRNTSAANLHNLVLTAFLSLLVIPLAYFLLPQVPVALLTGKVTTTLSSTSLPSTVLQWVLIMLLLSYFLGVVIKLLSFSIDMLKLKQLKNEAIPIRELQASTLIMDAKNAFEITKSIQLVKHSKIKMPITWGVRQAYVGLPSNYEQWEQSKLKRVLLHELAHIKRNDAFVNIIVSVVEAVMWCVPTIKLLKNKIHWFREIACDDLVLDQGVDCTDYAQDLLDFTMQRTAPIGQAVALIDVSQDFNRIHAILDGTRVKANNNTQWPVFALIVVLLFGFVGTLSLEIKPSTYVRRLIIWPAPSEFNQPVVATKPIEGVTNTFPEGYKAVPLMSVAGWQQQSLAAQLHIEPQLKESQDTSFKSNVELPNDLKAISMDLSTPFQIIEHVMPEYPKKALNRGYEGEVEVVFDILPNGLTSNIRIVKSDKKNMFGDSVLAATQQFIYQPRWESGKPVKTKNVKEVFKFQIFEDAK